MSVGLEQVREEMARYLREKGVRARTAWPPERPRELDRPEVCNFHSAEVSRIYLRDVLGL